MMLIFFFQAEDGIRDLTVTGVQTCALPVAFCRIGRSFALNHVFERPIEISVERVRSIWVCGKVAPMFVHPEPRRRVFSHIWFKRVPTCLCDLLMSHPICVADLRMEDKPVTPIRQWFAMRGNDRDAGPFVQPGMRGSHTCF